jgi:hypothetical protein
LCYICHDRTQEADIHLYLPSTSTVPGNIDHIRQCILDLDQQAALHPLMQRRPAGTLLASASSPAGLTQKACQSMARWAGAGAQVNGLMDFAIAYFFCLFLTLYKARSERDLVTAGEVCRGIDVSAEALDTNVFCVAAI